MEVIERRAEAVGMSGNNRDNLNGSVTKR